MLVPFNAGGEANEPMARIAKAAMESGLSLMVHWNVMMGAPPLRPYEDRYLLLPPPRCFRFFFAPTATTPISDSSGDVKSHKTSNSISYKQQKSKKREFSFLVR